LVDITLEVGSNDQGQTLVVTAFSCWTSGIIYAGFYTSLA